MSEPIALDDETFFEFITRPGLSVVFVSVHPLHVFNPVSQRLLEGQVGVDVSFGSIDMRRLLVSQSRVLSFLHHSLAGLRGPSRYGALPGYWLFGDGRLLAYDAGLPSFEDAKPIAGGTLLGLAWSSVTQKVVSLGKALQGAANEAAGRRLARLFLKAALEYRDDPRAAAGPAASGGPDELSWAYRLLGVSPDATDAEVNAAWRRLRMENHPDLAANDPEEFARRSQVSVQLNRARDVILEHRGRTRRAA